MDVASDSTAMLSIVQSAAGAVDITQTIDSNAVAISATTTSISGGVTVPTKTAHTGRSILVAGGLTLAACVSQVY